MSSIAVFLALGGGYALAFSGSGTLQKGSATNLTGAQTTVRTLTGIGVLKARCSDEPNGTTVLVHNSSGEELRVKFASDGGGASGDSVIANGAIGGFNAVGSPGTTRMHIWPSDGSKAPQADIVVSTFPAVGSDCFGPVTNSRATVLALNTQQ
jgi:hypothetical protein